MEAWKGWKGWSRLAGAVFLVSAIVGTSSAAASLQPLPRVVFVGLSLIVGVGLVVFPARTTVSWGVLLGFAGIVAGAIAGLNGTELDIGLLVPIWVAWLVTIRASRLARVAGVMVEPAAEPKGPPPDLI